MIKAKRVWGLIIVIMAVIGTAGAYLAHANIPVLEPKGPIADKEFRLLVLVTLIMLIVVVPTFALLIYISLRYREGNKKTKKYQPNWDHNSYIEGTWWAIPSLIIGAIAIITWQATYSLNPFRPIASKNSSLTIQVVAMNWKWLFIYPEQRIATVNEVDFPVNTPIHFYITSDAPMNSFWLPQLSGQIYAMAGMQTQLYLLANKIGTYDGHSANISGIGFANMNFTAKTTSMSAFNNWVDQVKSNSPKLNRLAYIALSRPSSEVSIKHYTQPMSGLFNAVMNQYMVPNSGVGYEGA